MLHPQRACKQDGGRRRGRERCADSSKCGKECHWTIASHDPMARPRRAHARPSSVSAAMRSPAPARALHRFDDADERQLASRVTCDRRFDRHSRARQHIGGECRLPVAAGLQLTDGYCGVSLNHSSHGPQVRFGHRAHGLRLRHTGVQLVAPDGQADAEHRHPAAPLSHRVGGTSADQGHRPKHVAHHLHVRLSADDLGASSDKFRSGRQGRLDDRPGGGAVRM